MTLVAAVAEMPWRLKPISDRETVARSVNSCPAGVSWARTMPVLRRRGVTGREQRTGSQAAGQERTRVQRTAEFGVDHACLSLRHAQPAELLGNRQPGQAKLGRQLRVQLSVVSGVGWP